jgi:hypothetical protein
MFSTFVALALGLQDDPLGTQGKEPSEWPSIVGEKLKADRKAATREQRQALAREIDGATDAP